MQPDALDHASIERQLRFTNRRGMLQLFGLQEHTPILIGCIVADLHMVDSAIHTTVNNKR
jgi:hypothetical protein